VKPAPDSIETFIAAIPGSSRPMFDQLYARVRAAAPALGEALRWGSLCFKGRNHVCGIGVFKDHVSLTLWRGASVKDPSGQLVHGQGRSEMRTAKFDSLTAIDTHLLESWIKQAAMLDAVGAVPRVPETVKVVVPRPLATALRGDAVARATFDAFPPYCRREYCEWISEAKQPATVERRLAATLEKLRRGESLNEKYRK
jgi:hypothetical protein